MQWGMKTFVFSKTSDLIFGKGSIRHLSKVVRNFGTRVLFITGKDSFHKACWKDNVLSELKEFEIVHISESGEPTSDTVNNHLYFLRKNNFDCVVSVGGGSIIDLGKALSAMLTVNEDIECYLEGLPQYRLHPGYKIPFIAIPTTAGTGSEATKNAVISKIGKNGYKRSLRHNNFIPNVAIIDPELHFTCPAYVTACSGMDALTQLIESYLSPQANEITDIFAEKGIQLIFKSLKKVYINPVDIDSRSNMALAAYFSGITLANAGLGAVHGFASSIGGMYEIPHGAICGCLLPKTLEKNLNKMIRIYSENDPMIQKINFLYHAISESHNNITIQNKIDSIIEKITKISTEINIPNLKQLNVSENDFLEIIAKTQTKNNPVPLDKNELYEILINS